MYCRYCGNRMEDGDRYCPVCGAPAAPEDEPRRDGVARGGESYGNSDSGIKTAVRILLVLTCIPAALLVFPLAWVLPMTFHYWSRSKAGEPVSTAFSVCTLLFVNLIAGVLMLVDAERR